MVSGSSLDPQKGGGAGAQTNLQVLSDFWQEMGHEYPEKGPQLSEQNLRWGMKENPNTFMLFVAE